MKLVDQCPYKYKRIYIDKEREPSGIPAVFGQAIHHVYKDALVNNVDRKQSIKSWRSYFERELSNNSPTIDSWVTVATNYDWWESRGYPAIHLFYNNLESFDIKEVLFVEQKMSGVFDGENFSFVCDLLYKNSKGEKILLDYKTGKEKIVDYLQMAFYDGRLEEACDKICLFYIFSGPIWMDKEKHQDESNKFVREGLAIAKSGIYNRVFNKYCKTCLFYKDDCSKHDS